MIKTMQIIVCIEIIMKINHTKNENKYKNNDMINKK
jgi:hypothetical protein